MAIGGRYRALGEPCLISSGEAVFPTAIAEPVLTNTGGDVRPKSKEPETVSDLYRSLDRRGQREQESFAADLIDEPGRLALAFEEEARQFKGFGPNEAFHPAGTRKALPRNPNRVGSTKDFASFLWQPPRWKVVRQKDLDFHYVDREIVTSRTTKGTHAASFSLDLLLANAEDQTPILAELKIRGDENAFYALVQALVHAARIGTPKQLRRLERFYADPFKKETPSSRVDIYIVLVEHPVTGTRPNLLRQAKLLADQAMAPGSPITARVRQIACIEGRQGSTPSLFKLRFLSESPRTAG